jgi:hypothetical protein
MLVCDTFWWIMRSCQVAAQTYREGRCQEELVDKWSTHLVVQIRKLNDQNLLFLARLPEA